jgi:hypothetical protein
VRPDDDHAAEKPKAGASPVAPISWRRDLFGVLYGSGGFLVFLVLSDMLPVLIYLGSLVFLPVGIWVGRGSRRTWLDGLVYSGFCTLVVAVFMVVAGYPGWVGVFAALFLALPQGIVGVWLGARLFPLPQKKR